LLQIGIIGIGSATAGRFFTMFYSFRNTLLEDPILFLYVVGNRQQQHRSFD
jgi:hypothetical protein